MSSPLLAIKIRRRLVAAAIFAGQSLEHLECLHLCDEPENVIDSVARFLAHMLEKFRPSSAAISLGPSSHGQRVNMLMDLVERMLRSEIVSIWKIEDKMLLESFARPKLKSKRQLKDIVQSFWPQLEPQELVAFEAAALGFYVQTERLFSYH
jgi:hypothetical protein